jgi:hypothetical protein
MKKLRYSRALAIALIVIVFGYSFSGCKKDKLKSKYASLLQHKWNIKSQSKRNIVIGSFIGSWVTTQLPSNFYREFRDDGTWSNYVPGSTYTATYEFLSDSIIIYPHPATVGIPYSIPDTSFIRLINDTLYLSYTRKYFISPNFSTLDEAIDSLVR